MIIIIINTLDLLNVLDMMVFSRNVKVISNQPSRERPIVTKKQRILHQKAVMKFCIHKLLCGYKIGNCDGNDIRFTKDEPRVKSCKP